MSKPALEKKILDPTGHEFIEVIGAREHNLKTSASIFRAISW